MIDPCLALQTGVRNALINAPAVTALVPADHIRTGQMRKESLPCIIMAGTQTQFVGHGAGAQFIARVWLDLHIWALDAGQDTAKAIAFAVQSALLQNPSLPGCSLDEFDAKNVIWVRDPDPQFAHGVVKIEAVVRWKL